MKTIIENKYIRNFAEKWGLLLIIVVYLSISLSYSILTPAYEAPDEWVHILWIKNYATHNIDAWTFFAHGPLYYFTTSLYANLIDSSDVLANSPPRFSGNPPSHWLHGSEEIFPFEGFSRAVHLLRSFSIVLGIITIFFTFKIAQTIFGKEKWAPLFTTSLLIFIPKFTFISGILNNDNLGVMFTTVSVFFLIKAGLNPTKKNVLLLGIITGLAILSKTNAIILIPVILIVFVWKIHSEKWNLQKVTTRLALFSLGLSSCLWWVYLAAKTMLEGTRTGGALSLLVAVTSGTAEIYFLRRANIKLFNAFWTGLLHINVWPSIEIMISYWVFTAFSILCLAKFFVTKVYRQFSSEQKFSLFVVIVTALTMLIIFIFVVFKGGGMARNLFIVYPEFVILIGIGIYYFFKKPKLQKLVIMSTVGFLAFTSVLTLNSFAATMHDVEFESDLKTDDPFKNMMTVWKSRVDLPRVYPEVKEGDYNGFINWILTYGVQQYPILLGDDKEVFQLLKQYYVREDLQEKFPSVRHGKFDKILSWYENVQNQLPEYLNVSLP